MDALACPGKRISGGGGTGKADALEEDPLVRRREDGGDGDATSRKGMVVIGWRGEGISRDDGRGRGRETRGVLAL